MKLSMIVLASMLGIAACGGDLNSPPAGGTSSLAVSPGDPQATGTVRGTVLGSRLTNPLDSTSFEHVSSASVGVYLEFTHLPADSSQETPLHRLVGTVTTDAAGSFELTSVPNAAFSLTVTPPAGSPYAPVTSGTYAFTDQANNTAVVRLHLK